MMIDGRLRRMIDGVGWRHLKNVDVGTDPELPEILLLLLLNSVNSLILTDRCVGKCMGTGPKRLRYHGEPRKQSKTLDNKKSHVI